MSHILNNLQPRDLLGWMTGSFFCQAHSREYFSFFFLSISLKRKGFDPVKEVMWFPACAFICLGTLFCWVFFVVVVVIRVTQFILPLITAYALCNYSVNTCIRIVYMCGGGRARK